MMDYPQANNVSQVSELSKATEEFFVNVNCPADHFQQIELHINNSVGFLNALHRVMEILDFGENSLKGDAIDCFLSEIITGKITMKVKINGAEKPISMEEIDFKNIEKLDPNAIEILFQNEQGQDIPKYGNLIKQIFIKSHGLLDAINKKLKERQLDVIFAPFQIEQGDDISKILAEIEASLDSKEEKNLIKYLKSKELGYFLLLDIYSFRTLMGKAKDFVGQLDSYLNGFSKIDENSKLNLISYKNFAKNWRKKGNEVLSLQNNQAADGFIKIYKQFCSLAKAYCQAVKDSFDSDGKFKPGVEVEENYLSDFEFKKGRRRS